LIESQRSIFSKERGNSNRDSF